MCLRVLLYVVSVLRLVARRPPLIMSPRMQDPFHVEDSLKRPPDENEAYKIAIVLRGPS